MAARSVGYHGRSTSATDLPYKTSIPSPIPLTKTMGGSQQTLRYSE